MENSESILCGSCVDGCPRGAIEYSVGRHMCKWKKGFAKDIQRVDASLKTLAETNLKIEIAPFKLARNC
jgi:ferredoxin